MQKTNSKNYSPRDPDNSQTERIDELERYYKPIESLDNWDTWFFWLSAIFSIAVFFKSQIPWNNLQDLPEVLFVIFVVVHLVFSLYIRFYLFPTAERKRRRQLLSDSFAVPLLSEITQKYYNNDLAPSVGRLGANVLENTLFAKTICSKMALRERAKILIYFVIWILAVFWRGTNLGLLVVITQTLFSSEIIENWIRVELLRHETEKFYDELYSGFLHKVDLSSPDGIASILDTYASYEAAKSMTGVRQLRSIFFSINPELSREWTTIQKRLGITKTSYTKKGNKK